MAASKTMPGITRKNRRWADMLCDWGIVMVSAMSRFSFCSEKLYQGMCLSTPAWTRIAARNAARTAHVSRVIRRRFSVVTAFASMPILLLLVLESGWVKSGNALVGMIFLEFWTESRR